MTEIAELVSLVRLLIGLLVLTVCVVAGFGAGLLSRMRALERRLTPTVADMAGFLRSVRDVRRIRAAQRTRRARRQRPVQFH